MPADTPNEQVPAVEPGQAPPVTPAPDPITRKDLEDFGKTILSETKEMVSKGFQSSQSHTDRVEKNVRQDFDNKLGTALQRLGVKVTPEALAEAGRQVVLDEMIDERIAPAPGESAPAGPGAPSDDGAPQDDGAQYVTDLADQLCKKLGVEFSESDDEWAAISAAAETGDALGYLDVIREQAAKKIAREASARDGRIPVVPDKGGPANPLDGLTNDQLWKETGI